MLVSNPGVACLEDQVRLSLQSGDLLPSNTDSLWQIDSGFVRTLTWNEEGDLVTLGVWGPGDVVGRQLSSITPYQMACLTSVQVQPLPVSTSYLCEAMRLHVRAMEELLSIIICKRAPHRLLKFLYWLAHRFGRRVEQGQMIDVRLTHQLLAEITGITRVTTTRLLNQFEREGKLIRVHNHRILLRTYAEHFWPNHNVDAP